MTLPKFDFSSMNLDQSALNEKIEADKKASRQFFKPGSHEVTVTGLEYKGQVESNPTWAKYRISYEGTYNKTISDLVMVPTQDVTFKNKEGKDTLFPYRKLVELMASLGVELNLTNLGANMKKFFGSENSPLIGKNLKIETAYTGPHIKYQGKSAAGQSIYQVVKRNEEPIFDNLFASYDEAGSFAEQNNVEVRGFVDVVKYVSSSTPAQEATDQKKAEW